MQVFVTGFGPFGRHKENPSQRLAESYAPDSIVLDVSYDAAKAWVDGFDPSPYDAIVLTGVATNRKHTSLELFARNHRALTQDNAGSSILGDLVEGGELLITSTLWTPERVARLASHEVHASLNAGAYLCNAISYWALMRWPDRLVGFLHLPDPQFVPIPETVAAARALIARL
ncbi:MAG: hypothetical protein JST35_07315 [Armatimonadetes bacterium]|nr:hypothetical protein [Armatimonadota bacterium]